MTKEGTEGTDVREELRLLLGDDIIDKTFKPRKGLHISTFSLTPSEKHLSGANGVKIEHLPLNQKETELLGLQYDPKKPIKATLMVLAPNQERKLIKTLTDTEQTGNPLVNSENFYGVIADSVLGMANTYPDRNAQIDFLKKSTKENPDKEILIFVGHGLETNKFEPKSKLVGSFADGSIEYIEHILDALDLRQYSVILDSTCNHGWVPEFHPSPVPYFASLVKAGGITTSAHGVIVINGKYEEFPPKKRKF